MLESCCGTACVLLALCCRALAEVWALVLQGWEGAERSLLSGSPVTLQCLISANEETGSWLWLKTSRSAVAGGCYRSSSSLSMCCQQSKKPVLQASSICLA